MDPEKSRLMSVQTVIEAYDVLGAQRTVGAETPDGQCQCSSCCAQAPFVTDVCESSLVAGEVPAGAAVEEGATDGIMETS